MPDEVVTLEAPVVEVSEPTLATENAPASSTEEQQAPTEGTEAAKELSLVDVASDPDLLRKAIESGVTPEDIHRAIREQDVDTSEDIRREADRIRTQEREQEDAVKSREAAFSSADAVGRSNARWLLQQASAADTDPAAVTDALFERITDPDGRSRSKFSAALDSVYAGAIASTSLDFERTVNALLEQEHKPALDALPEAKKAELRKARYEFATKGNPEPLLRLAFEAVSQHTAVAAEAKGEKKGEKNAEATKKNLDTIERLRKAGLLAQPAVNGKTPASVADARAQIQAEMNAIDVNTVAGNDEWTRRQPEFQRRLRALDK